MAKHTLKKALKPKSHLKKRILSGLLTTSMVMGMCTLYQPTTLATTSEIQDTKPSGTADTLLNLKYQEPSGFSNAKNPYGYKEGVAFNLSTRNEMFYYGGWDSNNETTELNGNDLDTMKSFVNSPNTKTKINKSVPSGTWNWIETVAFDSSKDSTKDDKVLFLAVEEDENAYAWVLDYNTNKYTTPLKLGNMSWISNDYDQYSSTSLFSVAAGDFNGDGVDSLLVYTPLNLNDSEKTGCSLFELSYNGSSLSNVKTLNGLLMDKYIEDQKKSTYKDGSTDNSARDKLAVSMQVGDFNGDSYEDLAVLSYSHKRSSGGTIDNYSPQLKICYGNTDFSLSNTAELTYTVSTKSDSKITIPVGASLAAGDFNADSICDLYVVGVEAYANSGSNLKDISVNGGKWYTHAFLGNLAKKNTADNTWTNNMTNIGSHLINSNAWFEDGFYKDDNTYGETLATGVAISGKASAEMLFIAGSLYSVFDANSSDGAPRHVKTISYFTSGDEGVTRKGESHVLTNTYMQSVQVGNFDGNDAGREQVAFIVGLKQKNQDDYFFQGGTLWGSDFSDTTYSDGSTCYGPATSYSCTSVDDDASYIHFDKGDDLDEGLNCFILTLDYDDDATQAKYLGVNYVYTDPTILAVLQAAPYFKDICKSAPTLNSTSYTITTSYSSSDSESNSLDGKVGFAASGKIPLAGSASAAIGIKGGFTSTYTSTYEESYSKSFAAGGENLVITSRTPLFIYQYDIYDKNTGWSGKTQMELSMPQAPYTVSLSVDDYNAFADSYNAQFDYLSKEEKEKINKLEKINKEENWMANNEGNPYGYNPYGWNGGDIEATKINQGEASALGKSGDVTTISKTEGNSVAEDFESYVGFYSQETVLFGSEIASYGIDLAGEYAHGWGFSETTGEAKTLSFAVSALSTDYAPKEVLEYYNFNWTCGSWKRNLGNLDENGKKIKTPFLGYSVTDVTSLPGKVTDFSVVSNNSAEPSLTFSWSKPETLVGGPEIDGYVIYQKTTNGEYSLLHTIKNADTTEITLTKLLNDASIEVEKEYSFMIKSYHSLDENSAYYSDKSNIATIKVPTTYAVNLEYDKNAFKNITVLTQDSNNSYNIEVSDGDRLLHGQTININATANDDYVINKVTITSNGVTTDIPLSEDGKTVSYTHIVWNDTTIKFETAKNVEKAVVTYTNQVKNDKGTVIGKISASIDGFPISSGAEVSDPITFTATPTDGYALENWIVVTDGSTNTYKANDNNELILPLTADKIDVTATFVKTSETLKTITVKQPDEGGKIALYDKDNTELTPDENGNYKVEYNSEVTFVAVPNTGYKLSAWTDDAAEQTSDQFTMNVTDDITVGVKFKAPVKYTVTYTEVDEHGNKVTPTPYVASGGSVAAGTVLNFKATAAQGYRIESFKSKKVNSNETQTIIKQYRTEYSKPVTISDGTIIEVSFVEVEQYKVRTNVSGSGKLTILQGNRKLKDGDTVKYMDSIKLIAKPDKDWKLTSIAGWTNLGDGTYSKEIKNITKDLVIDLAFKKFSGGMFGSSLESTPDEEISETKPDNSSAAPQTGEGSFTGYCIMVLFAAVCVVMIATRKRNA